MLTKQAALDIVTDGVANFAEATQDMQLVEASRYTFDHLADVVSGALDPNAKCLFALPSFLVRPDLRVNCFVTIQPTLILVAWKEGFLRKRPKTISIDPREVSDVTYGPGSGSTSKALLMTIIAQERRTVLALPVEYPQLPGQIKNIIKGAPGKTPPDTQL